MRHAAAANYPATDWAGIVRLYDLLISVRPSSSAALARAVAVAEAQGPQAGLAALDDLPAGPRVDAVRSELLARTGRYAEAVTAGERSLQDAANDAERRHRVGRIAQWRAAAAPTATSGPGSHP